MLTAICDRTTTKNSMGEVGRALGTGATALHRDVRWQGGGREYRIQWRQDIGMWYLLMLNETKGRFWCCFGLEDPRDQKNLKIVCEINPPLEGDSKRTAGRFVRDDNGDIYLTHSGKIGGGRKGIGKHAFVERARGLQFDSISWPKGGPTEAIVIGRVGSDRLPQHIASFVREVERVKALIVGGDHDRPIPKSAKFTPEFEGPKRPYRSTGTVEQNCDHGLVVRHLAEWLGEIGQTVENSRKIDLYLRRRTRMTHLFEVKTDLSTTSLYTGLGQVLLHSAAEEHEPRKILVLPGSPNRDTVRALKRLGVEVQEYHWEGGEPRFLDVDKLFR